MRLTLAENETSTSTEQVMTNSNSTDTMDPEEVEMTLQELEDHMKDVINNLMKQISPYIFRIGPSLGASHSCLWDLVSFYFAFKRLEPWTFRMLDASGKLSAGLMEGTASALGDYDECLEIVIGNGPKKPRSHTGQYCLLEVKPPAPIVEAVKDFQVNRGNANHSLAVTKTFLGVLRKIRTNPNHVMFRLGICMPSSCSVNDVQSFVDLATGNLNVPAEVVRCETKQQFTFRTHQIIILSAIAIITGLVILGTVVNCLRKSAVTPEESVEPNISRSNAILRKWFRSRVVDVYSKFCMCYNTEKLFECNVEGDAFDAVRGIKVLTVIFTIFTHTYALPHPLHLYRFRNTLNFSKFIDDILFGAVANSSVGVDTIFFLAGFICVYNRWRLLKKPTVHTYILKFLFITYLRMVFAQTLVICLFSILPALGSGPLWTEFIEQPLENCRKTWWMNLLFIQNFLGPYDSCLYHTWILATMMQIFIITGMVIWIMHRWPFVGVFCNIGIVLIAAVIVALVTAVAGFPATFTIYFYDYRNSIKLWKLLYVQAYNHIGPHCIGMLTAYFVAEYSTLKFKRRAAIPLWIAAIFTLSSIIFGLHSYRDGQEMNRALAIFYSAVHRPVWALAISWVVYACSTGLGGIVTSILSWKAFIPLERLCYLAFLLHIPLMYYQGGIQRERMYMGHYSQIMCFVSYTVTSFVLSYVCYLLFQAPYQVIEGLIFGDHCGNVWNSSPASVSQDNLKNENSENGENNCSEEDKSRVLYNRYVQNDPS